MSERAEFGNGPEQSRVFEGFRLFLNGKLEQASRMQELHRERSGSEIDVFQDIGGSGEYMTIDHFMDQPVEHILLTAPSNVRLGEISVSQQSDHAQSLCSAHILRLINEDEILSVDDLEVIHHGLENAYFLFLKYKNGTECGYMFDGKSLISLDIDDDYDYVERVGDAITSDYVSGLHRSRQEIKAGELIHEINALNITAFKALEE